MSDPIPAPSTSVDVRIGRIEQDCAITRDKVERLHSEVATQGQLMRSLEDNSRATATATIELAAIAKARDERERREDERRAQVEAAALESRQAAVDRLLAAVAENWKYLARDPHGGVARVGLVAHRGSGADVHHQRVGRATTDRTTDDGGHRCR